MRMDIADKVYDTARYRVQQHSLTMNLIFDCEARDIYETPDGRTFKQQMNLISMLNYDHYLYMREIKWFNLGEPTPENPDWY